MPGFPVRFAAAALLALSAMTPGAPAQPAPERVDILRSHWYARASADALNDGDRADAILLALRGIPADPTEADLDPYRDAFDALWRGAASFSFQTDMHTLHIVFFSRSGQRALLFPGGEALGALSGEDVRLVSPRDGSTVATLVGLAGKYPFLFQGFDQSVSAFSPDERFVAISAVERGVGAHGFSGTISVYDAMTGAAIRTVPGDYFHGFSSDSRMMLAGDMLEGGLQLYDTQTWQRLGGTQSLGGVVSPFPGADGAFYLLENTASDFGVGGSLLLHRLDAGGLARVADLTELAAQDEPGVPQPVASETTPYFALATPTGELAIVGLDGRISARVPARATSASTMAFVRGGQAVAVSDIPGAYGSSIGGISVYALDGTLLESALEDREPFLDVVATPDGYRLGLLGGPRHYAAPGWPTGVALYERIWPQIPEQLRARIETERVVRPAE